MLLSLYILIKLINIIVLFLFMNPIVLNVFYSIFICQLVTTLLWTWNNNWEQGYFENESKT